MIVPLKKQTTIQGAIYKELDIKIEDCKGRDIVDCETGFRQLYRNEYVPVVDTDSRYHIFVAGRFCGVNPQDLIDELWGPDYKNVCQQVQNFLLGTGSQTSPPNGATPKS